MLNKELDKRLLEIFEVGENEIIVREGIMIECKESFSMDSRYKYSKILAGFANNRGGCILFGIKDGTSEIIGLQDDRFERVDTSKISEVLNSSFSPSIIWDKMIRIISDKKIGILYVYESNEKPVICKKNTNELKEGDIYYRYSGQTKKIMYSELVNLINKEKERLVNELFERVNMIRSIGVENSAILDLQNREIYGNNAKMIIDSESLPHMPFIKNGSFSEVDGKPVIKLLDTVDPVKIVSRTVVKSISVYDIISAFLNQEISPGIDPKYYLLQIGNELSQNYPIFFFIKKSYLKVDAITQYIKENLPGSIYKKRLLLRIENKNPKFYDYKLNLKSEASNSRKRYFESTLSQKIEDSDIKSEKELQYFLEGLTNLRKDQIETLIPYLFPILLKLVNKYYRGKSANKFRKLLIYFDFILYNT